MKRKEYIVLLLVVAVLSAYLLLKKRGSVHYSLPVLAEVNKDSIAELVIKKADSEIILKKKDNDWLISPEGSKASSTPIDRMTKTIEELKLTSLVSESKNYAVYGLDDKNKIVVTAKDVNNNILRKIAIGKPAAALGHTLITAADDGNIYHAKGNIRHVFDKTLAELRNMMVMGFGEVIKTVVINDGGEEIVISKVAEEKEEKFEEGGEVKTRKVKEEYWKTKDGKYVVQSEVDGIVSTLKILNCDKYIEGKKKEDLKDPIYTVSLKSGTKDYTVTLFKKEDNMYPAISSENDFPFLLAEWKVNKIKKGMDTFIKKID